MEILLPAIVCGRSVEFTAGGPRETVLRRDFKGVADQSADFPSTQKQWPSTDFPHLESALKPHEQGL